MHCFPQKYIVENTGHYFDHSYSSPLRNMSLVLNTLLESDPSNLQIPVMARQLSKAIQSASYLNTPGGSFYGSRAWVSWLKKTSGFSVTASVVN